MALADVGNEVGWGIRFRQCVELMINGGAGATIDSITQLITEAEATFDADATAKRMLPTVIGHCNNMRRALNSWMKQTDLVILALMRNRMSEDIDSVAIANDPYGLAGELARYMRDNSKSVLETTPAVSAVTAGGENVGDGTVLVDMLNTSNEDNQNIQNGADYWVTCYEDAITGSAEQHQEYFSIQSSFGSQRDDIKSCMYPDEDGEENVGGGNRLQNKDGSTPGNGANADTTIPFENFTSNTPDGWTVDTGSAGTQVLEESTEYYFGSKCLEIVGDAGGTLTQISQDAYDFFGATAGGTTSDQQALSPYAHYAIGYYMKSADTTGKISMYMDGTGYSAGAAEKATYDFGASGALASWTLVEAVVNMPKNIPSDMECIIKVETALGNGVSAYIDGAFLAKMHHIPEFGLNIAVVSGDSAFVYHHEYSDRFHFSTTS